MKIKYNLDYNYFNLYDAAQGIIIFKNLYKDNKKNVLTFNERGKTFLKYTLFIFIGMMIIRLFSKTSTFTHIVEFMFSLICGLLVFYYITFYLSYLNEKNRCHRGELLINKSGILDTSEDNIRIGVPWQAVDGLILTDKVGLITTKTNHYYILSLDIYDDVIVAIKKYQPDLKIVDYRLKKTDIVTALKEIEEIETLDDEKEDEEKKED